MDALTPAERLGDAARRLYADRVRGPVAERLLSGSSRTLSRVILTEDPPPYVTDLEYVDEPERVRLAEPPSVGPLPETIRERVGERTFDRPFVATLRDVQLVGPDALPVAPDGRYILEAADGSARRVADALVRAVANGVAPVRRGRERGRRIETAVSLVGPWSDEFFHWFADYLPRLRYLHRSGHFDADAVRFVVPADPPDWLLESLDLLSVPAERRVPWAGGRLTLRRLVVPSIPRCTVSTAPESGYVHSPRALSWLADRLRCAVGASDHRSVGDRLFISRAGTPSRRVLNEPELRSTLRTHDFEVVQPEEWSLAEQVATFGRADTVCGPHGAGLLNVIHGDNSTLLELFGARTNPCFYAITAGMGRQYVAHRATAAGDHLRVDPDRLAALLSWADVGRASAASK